MDPRVDKLEFKPRPLSWVARSSDAFYKVVRRGDNVEEDFQDPLGISEAQSEFDLMRFLSSHDHAVIRPLRLTDACIEYPLLSGPDMMDFLKRRANRSQFGACIESAMSLLGRLHRIDFTTAGFRVHEYEADPYHAADNENSRKIGDRPKSIVIAGYEVRNFRFDESRNTWCFFDPHEIKIGLPEEDFARFVVSLLMLNWGRNVNCSIWREFDLGALVDHYEAAAPMSLDRELLAYSFQLVLKMRGHFARKSTEEMGQLKRAMAKLYLDTYFHQMHKWIRKQNYAV